MPDLAAIQPKAACGVALGVKIDYENGVSGEGQVGSQVDYRGGLTDATLLVGAGDDLAHSGPHFGGRNA